jgi:hypothetical protein
MVLSDYNIIIYYNITVAYFFNVLPQWANGDIATGSGHFNLCDHYRECPVAPTRSLDVVAMGTLSPPSGNVAL